MSPSASEGAVERQPAATNRMWYRIAALALLAILVAELFFSVRQQSQTFDESVHLYAGFKYWKHGDFGVNPEHPPLLKFIAAVPLLPLHLNEPKLPPFPFFKAQDFMGASQFVYSSNADALLLRGRMALALLAVALGFLVFSAANEMFGLQTALIALALLAFEPVVLANGALITTDMGLACFFFGTVYAFYRYVKQPSLFRLALCAIGAGLTCVSKHSGALILPTLMLLAASELLIRRSVAAPDANSPQTTGRNVTLRIIGAVLVITMIAYLFIWAFYGFRYAARPAGLQIVPPLAGYAAALTSPTQKALIYFFAGHHLFPEAYLYGWVDILLIPDTRPSYVFGTLYSSGRWFFFPAVFLIKSSLTLLLLLALTPLAGLWKRRRELLMLALPPAFFLLIGIISGLNLGVRHILPIYPFCIVLAAATAWRLAQRSRAFAVTVAVLLLFAVGSSVHAFPDYLTYSNEAFGGPSNTYRVVTDANADWGQNLKSVKNYLTQRAIADCWFDYVNPFVNPAYYGIPCKPLPSALGHLYMPSGAPVTSPLTGNILLSSTEAEGFLWGPGVLNPYESFKSRQPDDVIAHSVLVYRGTFDVPLLAAETHTSSALALLQQRRVPEAIAEVQAAVQLAPNSAEIQAVRGQILMAAGRNAEAQQAFATALTLAHSIHPDFQKNLIRAIEHPNR